VSLTLPNLPKDETYRVIRWIDAAKTVEDLVAKQAELYLAHRSKTTARRHTPSLSLLAERQNSYESPCSETEVCRHDICRIFDTHNSD
jgi:hypothetical protein